MSHEIRTPLNGVIGLLDLMLGSDLNPEQRRYGRLARSSATVLTSVLGDILDISKIEAGKLDIVPCDFDLHEVVEEVIDMMAQPAARKGLEVGCYVDSTVPATVHADQDRFRQILVNLVNNAIKFTEKGSIVVRLSTECMEPDRALVRFAVTDTGIGIPADRRERLFKAFSQADASTTRVYGGTGLGLAISKQLAELMGGQIGVESEPGRGSTFWFTLAFKLPTHAAKQAPLPVDPRTIRVLAVDDSEAQRDVLNRQFAAWKLDASVAPDGETALGMLQEASADGKPFDVALVDLTMPGMDGIELAMAIRARRELRDIAIMPLISPEDEIDIRRLRDLGFKGHMTKPVRQSQLFNAIMDTIAITPQDARPLPPPAPASPPAAAKGLRILVAEDNEVNQIVVKEVLTRAGHTCEVVSDGKQAVDAVQKECFDVMLMDCQMPVLDGFEATREVRRIEADQPSRRRLPIVALTANAMKGDRERCLEAGMDAYATKPINPPELLRTIDQVLGLRIAKAA